VFHNRDKEITVKDLWRIWEQSEVRNFIFYNKNLGKLLKLIFLGS
jgi:hypothetical protein